MVPHTHGAIGTEIVLMNNLALNLIHFAVSAPAFIEGVRRFTGCDDLSWFDGRIYRFVPGAAHHDSWHDDVGEDRLVGMSVNLSSVPHQGGRFQLRDRITKAMHCEVTSTVLGNAHLFRISPKLQHRVDTVVGCQLKTAFAGWPFRSARTVKPYQDGNTIIRIWRNHDPL